MEYRQATQQSPGNQTQHVLGNVATNGFAEDWTAAKPYGTYHNKTFVCDFATPLRFDGYAESVAYISGIGMIEGQGISVVC
jgi:hypothetical protein